VADYILQRTLTVPRPLAAVFDFFSQAGNLETLTPPWLHFKIVRYALPLGPLGRLVHRLQVARDLAKIFEYREHRVRALLS